MEKEEYASASRYIAEKVCPFRPDIECKYCLMAIEVEKGRFVCPLTIIAEIMRNNP